MRGVVTIFGGDGIKFNISFLDIALLILVVASLLCMCKGRWKTASVSALVYCFAALYRDKCIDPSRLGFAVLISVIACFELKKEKQRKQQSDLQNTENQQQSELQQADENEHIDKR